MLIPSREHESRDSTHETASIAIHAEDGDGGDCCGGDCALVVQT
jgi:hypothetical protein